MAKELNYRYNKKSKVGTITLKGNLTIENIENIKKSVHDSLLKDGSLIINHVEAEDFDFSYLQLLATAIKTAETQKKEISILKCDSEKFRILMEDSGFNNLNLITSCFMVK